MRTNRTVLSALMVFAAIGIGAAVHGQDKKAPIPGEQKPVKTAPIKCPAQFQCKVPSRGVDYPVCHDGVIPPTCDKQSDCVKLGLGNRSCTRVAPFFSICVQACIP
jgi:hypothetical protein